MPQAIIREAKLTDAAAIADIYNHYITHTIITFDTRTITSKDMEGKIGNLQVNYPVLIIEQSDHVIGFAYASQWKSKEAYKYCAETTIYMHPEHTQSGFGQRLYNALLSALPLFDIVHAIACITIPNETSIKLHEKLGFHRIGTFSKVGYKQEQWIDVEYWQKHVV
jgi:L-amino acid N-acyltransferase YncA